MHPSLYYIKYLLVKGDETVESVNRILKAFGLPTVPEDVFEQIQAGLRIPKDLMISNKEHRPTIRFMREQGLYYIWNPKEEERAALGLMRAPLVRETVQILLMGRIPSVELVQWIEKKYGTEVHPKTIDTYSFYFWNCQLVSLDQWSSLLWDNVMRDHYLASFWGSRNQALYRAGFTPKINGKTALKEAQRSIAMRIEATRLMPDSKDTARILATLTKELVGVHAALYGEGAGAEDALRELRKIKLAKTDNKVLPLRVVAPGGNYSNSGQKTED